MIIFFFSSFFYHGGGLLTAANPVGLPHFVFMFLGILTHGIGLALGIMGYVKGAKTSGLLGIIGNGIIIFFTLLGGLIGAVAGS